MALKDLLQQLHVVVEDLATLDGSLTSLFETAPNTDVTEHQQLVQVWFVLHCIIDQLSFFGLEDIPDWRA